MVAALGRRVPPRLPDVAALALVALTALAGPAVLPRLPAEMVVGWHLGLGGQWSLTRGPRVVGLVVIPALSVGFAGAFLAVRRLASLDAGSRDRRLVDLGANLLLACLCVSQLSLIGLNL